MFQKGDFVSVNREVGVVVKTGEELPGDMGDHTGVWFGECVDGVPEARTIPTEYLEAIPRAMWKH